jgi:hypothetical protein
MVAIATKLDNKEVFFSGEVKFLLSRMESMESMLGNQHMNSESKYQSPTIWGSIGTLATNVEENAQEHNTAIEILQRDVQANATEIRHYVDIAIKEAADNWMTRVNNLSTRLNKTSQAQTQDESNILALARGAVKMKSDLHTVNDLVLAIRAEQRTTQVNEATRGIQTMTTGVVDTLPAKLDEVLDRVNALAQQVTQLRAESENESIKFFGLGFRDAKDAEVWANTHLEDCSYGIIVDAHLVMEHVYIAIAETDNTLTKMQQLYKLSIDNMTQGTAISSFESRVPKFFSKSSSITGAMLRKKGISHFDQIQSYKDWSETGHGFQQRLKDELRLFATAHTSLINDAFLSQTDSKAYALAKYALAELLAWIAQLSTYMDDTYNDLTLHNTFSPEKAWQLTTQLARRVFLEVSQPRMGVQNSFRVGDNEKIGKLMFWPIVKSHDIMQRYKDASFKDDATIASEYVKFLAANSGTDDKFTDRLASVETDLKNASKSMSSIEKSNHQNLNKVDELNKKLADIQKRIGKLEGGKIDG